MIESTVGPVTFSGTVTCNGSLTGRVERSKHNRNLNVATGGSFDVGDKHGTLQVGGTTLGTKNTSTNKIELENSFLKESGSLVQVQSTQYGDGDELRYSDKYVYSYYLCYTK